MLLWAGIFSAPSPASSVTISLVEVGSYSAGELPITVTTTETPDETSTIYFVLVPQGLGTPSAAQVKAGTDATSTAAADSWSETWSATPSTRAVATGLDAFFDLYAVINNGADSNVVGELNFEVDTTAPVLSSPTGTQTGQTTADWGVTSDEAGGTIFAAARLSASAVLSKSDIENGTGLAVSTSTDATPTADGANSGSFTGLTLSTEYDVDMFQRDTFGNESAVVSSAAFTTASASAFSVEVLPLTTTMISDPTVATFVAENLVGAGNIMVFPYTWDGFGRTLNTVTIDGVSASAITDGVVTTTYTLPGSAGVAGYEADVTGATGNLVFTFSALVNRCGVQGIRMVDGVIHDVRYVTSASGAALTSDVDVVSGGALFAFAVARNFNSGTNTFTNITATTGPTAINNDSEILLALETGISTTETRSITCNLDASSDKQMILVSMESI